VAEALDIDHAGFDVAMVDGYPYLLEFNRLFGNTGLQGLSQQVSDAILAHLQAANDHDDDDDDPKNPTPLMPVAV
jgi:ribosomal protein S6--L-glutamate ligase